MKSAGSILFAAVCHGASGLALTAIVSLGVTDLVGDAAVVQQGCYFEPIYDGMWLLVPMAFIGMGLISLSLRQFHSGYMEYRGVKYQ